MTKSELFMITQVKAIDEAKWLEGCSKNTDPGMDFVHEWVNQNASIFRDRWTSSICSNCANTCKCGHRCAKQCSTYVEYTNNIN